MPNDIISTDFSEKQLSEIDKYAKQLGLTRKQFVELATRKSLAQMKQHTKDLLKPDLRVIK